MKRLIVAAATAVVLVLLVSGLAFADGGPHGGYTPTTDACAGCHRAHTAVAANLLINTEAALCFTCHGSVATGADTDVVNGIYDGLESGGEGDLNRGLKGGGFDQTLMNTTFAASAPGAGIAFTSRHTYDGSIGTAWGNGAIDAGGNPGADISLSCASCHDPHGNGNYRILRPIPTESGAAADFNVTDEASKHYTIADATGIYFLEGYVADPVNGPTLADPMNQQYQELTDWCAQCHTRYMAPEKAALNDSGDAIFAYRHATVNTRSEGSNCGRCHNPANGFTYNDKYWRHDVECMTCHVAHGTSASMTGASGTDFATAEKVPYPDGTYFGTGSDRSALLRVDGRGTCQACHNKPGTPTP